MTNEQINELRELLADGLRRAEGNTPIPSESIELVLNRYKGELLKNFLHVVREFVKIVKGFTIPRAKVNRSRTPQEALDTLATMEQQVDPDVMTTMPGRDLNEKTPLDATADRTGNAGSFAETIMRQNPGEGDMFHFFQMEHEATDDEIAKKFTSLGLRPLTPTSCVG